MARAALIAGCAAVVALALWRMAHRTGSESRIEALRRVLASKNDNDPLLDTGFNGLSSEEKRRFRAEYSGLALERRNERGTIVYLLGRNLTSPEDWEFLREVASEPRCRSLADCSKSDPGSSAPGDEVTLAYPALVALKQAERALASDAGNKDARGVLEAAGTSEAPAVRRLLARLKRRLPR